MVRPQCFKDVKVGSTIVSNCNGQGWKNRGNDRERAKRAVSSDELVAQTVNSNDVLRVGGILFKFLT